MKVTIKYLSDEKEARMVPDTWYELRDGCKECAKGTWQPFFNVEGG